MKQVNQKEKPPSKQIVVGLLMIKTKKKNNRIKWKTDEFAFENTHLHLNSSIRMGHFEEMNFSHRTER